jgi:hypothetical protein
MVVKDGITEQLAAVGQWSERLEELHAQIAGRFARSDAKERVKRYFVGLLGRVERKNGWQLAEAIGEADPQGVQRLLNAAKWDADLVRDDLRDYVVLHLGDEESGVLIVDDTGFLKKGKKSLGVARQYTGTAGDTVSCQVGVFLAYTSERGAGFVDRALYLPRALEIFAFAGGAVVAFGIVGGLASGFFREALEDQPSNVKALGGAFALLSVGLALLVAYLVGILIEGMVAWPISAFSTTVAYIVAVGLELTLAEWLIGDNEGLRRR